MKAYTAAAGIVTGGDSVDIPVTAGFPYIVSIGDEGFTSATVEAVINFEGNDYVIPVTDDPFTAAGGKLVWAPSKTLRITATGGDAFYSVRLAVQPNVWSGNISLV
jgi:hypothetical protein